MESPRVILRASLGSADLAAAGIVGAAILAAVLHTPLRACRSARHRPRHELAPERIALLRRRSLGAQRTVSPPQRALGVPQHTLGPPQRAVEPVRRTGRQPLAGFGGRGRQSRQAAKVRE